MRIVLQDIRVIDYEEQNIRRCEVPQEFSRYLNHLINYIRNNEVVRDYITKSKNTEVINCIVDIVNNITNLEKISSDMEIIAKRLLAKEIEAQNTVSRLNTMVQKGSLVQALLFDEKSQKYSYLLAKVEHTDFVDDVDLTFRTGFSRDMRKIWKTCIYEINNLNAASFRAKVYSNTSAKYWYDSFLELMPMKTDQENTQKAIKAINGVLKKNLKKNSPKDYLILSHSVAGYLKAHRHFDYDEMINETIEKYDSVLISEDDKKALVDKLRELPKSKDFDRQFSPVSAEIKSNIKQNYEVYPGVRLQVTDVIDDIQEVVSAFHDSEGFMCIGIRTTNDEMFQQFYNNMDESE